MQTPVTRAGAALMGVLVLATACTYFNTIYNADQLFQEAERLRRQGRDSLAQERYSDVIRKAAAGFRSDPDGGWAYESAFLLGRAYLRSGDLQAAQAALRHSATLAENPDERLAVQVFQGVLEARLGRPAVAIDLFNEALAGATDPAVRGEGHLQRGRLLLQRDHPDGGWWDLDRAAEVHPPLRVEAALTRLEWGVVLGDRRRTEESVQRLLAYPEAEIRAGALRELLGRAERRWGSAAVADLLDGAQRAAWTRDARDGLALDQARVLRRAGRIVESETRVEAVADGRGPWAAGARVTLASWTLESSDEVGDAFGLRSLLLPALDQAAVAELLTDIDELERLAFAGLDEPLAWFLAGEIARDELGAIMVARELFIAYATSAPEQPWAPKALLAALQLTEDERERARLRERLEGHRRNPYVLAARGAAAVGFEALEEQLLVRLSEIRR
jgi:tetratricopeptide (TPR) repeat protein